MFWELTLRQQLLSITNNNQPSGQAINPDGYEMIVIVANAVSPH